MIAVLTGDIIHSAAHAPETWMPLLKGHLSRYGQSPGDWEIYRGDEFQLRTTPGRVLESAIGIKACIKQIKYLDVRMGIGLGDEIYVGAGVSDSNGTAYQRSGRTLESLKGEKRTLGIQTGQSGHDRTLNLILSLAAEIMDNWSPVSAEIISLVLLQKEASQEELASLLSIKQSAVSQRLKRARHALMSEVLLYFKEKLPNLAS